MYVLSDVYVFHEKYTLLCSPWNVCEIRRYCIPSNAEHVLKVNLKTEEVTEIGPALTDGQNKFYGGIKGLDGCIYGMPYTATGVIRIDPRTDSVEILGDYPIGGYKWHGGLLAHSTGVIYAFPAHANERWLSGWA